MSRLIAVLAVAALFGAAVWFGLGPGANPPLADCSAVPVTSAASEGPIPPEDVPTVRWTIATLPPHVLSPDEQILYAVASFRGGFVAVGSTWSLATADYGALLLASPDGQRWTANAIEAGRLRGTEFHSLRVVGDRLFALGATTTDDRGGSRGALWFTDDGRTWTEAVGDFEDHALSTIAGGPDGLLLLGSTTMEPAPTAWRSSDGSSWNQQSVQLPVPASQASLRVLTTVPGGWMALGSIAGGGRAAPIEWRSTDGVRWTCQRLDAAEYPVAQPVGLQETDSTRLATGTASTACGPMASCVGYGIAWTSSDGRPWEAAMTEEVPISGGGMAFASTRDRFIAVGHDATWVSRGGRVWVEARADGRSEALEVQPDGLTATADGGTLVAVGTAYEEDDRDPWIAVGEIVGGH